MFKHNKLWIFILVIITCFLLAGSAVFAEAQKVGTVTGNNLNVREAPELTANVLTQLSKGTKVIVISNSEEWYNISFNETNGWVFSQYLSLRDESIGSGTINGNTVNIRENASLTSTILTTLDKGEIVDVLDKSGDWYKISFSDGKCGWVFNKYLVIRDVLASRGTSERDTTAEPTKTADKSEAASNKLADFQNDLINYAKKFLGVKYQYGKSSPSAFDCSGFTQYVFKHFDIKLKRSAKAQSTDGKKVNKSDLRTGDLVFFDTNGGLNDIRHVGLYIGKGKFIHASSGKSTGKVVISDITTGFYAKSYMTARRVF